MPALRFVTISAQGKLTPDTVCANKGDIVAFHADGADAVLCFDKAALFGAYRYTIPTGETLPLAVQAHAPLGLRAFWVQVGDLRAECASSDHKGVLKISDEPCGEPERARTDAAAPSQPGPSIPTGPGMVITTMAATHFIPEGSKDFPDLNVNRGESVTFHARDTDAVLVVIPATVFGEERYAFDVGQARALVVQQDAPDDYVYRVCFDKDARCDDRDDEGGGKVGGGG